MWNRFKRLLRSIFGGLISSSEDPKLILEQLMRDMQDEVPKMRNNVSQVMGAEKRLGMEVQANQTKLTDLDNKIKASIRLGKDDIATALITEMKIVQQMLANNQQNHEKAKVASLKAREYFDDYVANINRRMAEAKQLIAANKNAELQEQLASTMASFQAGDFSQSFDDMREKIANRQAAAEARAELASTGLDSRMQSVEKELANIEAQDMLLAYKQQMGLAPAAAQPALGEGAPALNMEKTLGAADAAQPERGKLTE